MIYLYVSIGGVVGAVSRFAIGRWLASDSVHFPWATFLINLSGSLLLGFLLAVLPNWSLSAEMRALLTIGFCGSFTTFSTFGYETITLLQNGSSLAAVGYVLGSVLLGVGGVAIGLAVGSAVA